MAFISNATRQFTDVHFEDRSSTDLKTVHRHTVLRALCARAAESICLSACLPVTKPKEQSEPFCIDINVKLNRI